ncbi:MAG: bifunctional 5,10-methylenetetrahydrofolate dehydrogenase/5,10-methenyltetrahydrofolate cyclohydrolase [Lactobacillales bacterium]|jgi:methylenetetrahydrofolate dehydrogenase (NADP+)/methenyltetrahydrofolate cyclohydrolase|nr:bifunctional 5,10-methylenetetrahydrofolate dehydrogenase/5,10-methenyltetrahydrofolate cyclohydrolase [Lactobacillales bacterium]
METQIINGKELAAKFRETLAVKIKELKKAPTLAVVLVGEHPASLIYVKNKQNVAEKIGIRTKIYHLSPVLTQDALIEFVKDLNNDPEIDGILVQMPLPAHIDSHTILETIDPKKDADGLHSANLGKLFTGYSELLPCTPMACMELVYSVTKAIAGLKAVVVGRSRLVGKPVAQLLLDANCTVTQAHSYTKDLESITKSADILVVAVGKAGLITKKHVKKGAIVIDVGINRLKTGKLAGDVVFDEMIGHAGAITPVPGGVGPMTITMIFQNMYKIVSSR